MKFSSRQAGFAVVAAIVAVATLVAPVTADTPISHSGTMGAHSLRDTEAGPGATCRFTRVTPGSHSFEAKLTKISVKPPRMKAYAGTQKVAWLFIVQRAAYTGTFGPWSTKHTSPLQTRWTNASTNAAFDQMSVDITVPNGGFDDEPIYIYRVRVLMFWYSEGGTVNATSTHQVDWYKEVMRPVKWSEFNSVQPNCGAWVAADI